MTFEEFIVSTRPPYLVYLEKDEEGKFINEKTQIFFTAWTAGMNMATFDTFKLLMTHLTDWSIDKADPRCFSLNLTQRHYWCYITAKHEASGKWDIPFLSNLL